MDRDQLREWLDAGLSLPQIGVLTNRDPSTVGYWVQKHGLVANGKAKYAPRGGLARGDLEELVEAGKTLAEIAEVLNRSTSTVRHWLNRYGLKTKRHHRNQTKALEALENGAKRFVGLCNHHGETEFLVWDGGRSRCARCNTEAVARRRREIKRTLVAEAGGKCVACGFDRHQAALQFHHRERGRKRFALSRKGHTISLERARAEARKCTLLCANCHALVEAGVISVS